jgi:hypothetical protein
MPRDCIDSRFTSDESSLRQRSSFRSLVAMPALHGIPPEGHFVASASDLKATPPDTGLQLDTVSSIMVFEKKASGYRPKRALVAGEAVPQLANETVEDMPDCLWSSANGR